MSIVAMVLLFVLTSYVFDNQFLIINICVFSYYLNRIDDMSKKIQISDEKIKTRLLKEVDETTSYNSLKFDSLDDAVTHFVKTLSLAINEFTILDQQIITEQEINYPDSLLKAEVGHLVWGDNECWVSESVVDDWTNQAQERLTEKHNNIEDLADWVQHDLILEVLSEYNTPKT